jgi:hypothetical protein
LLRVALRRVLRVVFPTLGDVSHVRRLRFRLPLGTPLTTYVMAASGRLLRLARPRPDVMGGTCSRRGHERSTSLLGA